jgi:uncharacterized protein YndB with AHSA1/START domain
MNTNTNTGITLTLPSDTEIVMERVFDAPRELVWQAHSACEHLTQWWARGHDMSCEMDFRPGGAYRFVEHAPDGNDYAFRGEYREIVAPERIVQTFEFEGMPGVVAVETLTLVERDGRTTITAHADFGSKENRDGMLSSGMEAGAAQSWNHLEEVLRKLA